MVNGWRWVEKPWSRATNIINKPLVDQEKILYLPLHIKLGLMRQYTKALDFEGSCFRYLCQVFPGPSMEKLKAGIFYGPQICQPIRDPVFKQSMNTLELEAWKAFVLVIQNFLGNYKASNYEELVTNMITCFKKLGCNMSIKMRFLFSHMNCFPENLGAVSDEQDERFHHNMKQMETRYNERWDAVLMADYCWTLKRDVSTGIQYSRGSKNRKYVPWIFALLK